MIRARIRKSFAGANDSRPFALDVQFEAATGITVLFGPSGSGKTLTLNCVSGFERPDEGRILLDDAILFDGQARVFLPPQERRCGYVFQNYALFPHMTLRENLDFAVPPGASLERRRRTAEMLERFQLDDVAAHRPHQLSGGQKQRGSIARALLANPRALLLDEPAQGLDAPLRQELYAILGELQESFPMPVLLVTHDLEEALALGDTMHVFRDGRIVQSGAPRQVLDAPASTDAARLFGLYNLIPAEILALDPGRGTSRLRVEEGELNGPYFPGHLKGARVTLCFLPSRVSVSPREGAPPNALPAKLLRAVPATQGFRLHFAEGFRADVSRSEWETLRPHKAFAVSVPPEALTLVKG